LPVPTPGWNTHSNWLGKWLRLCFSEEGGKEDFKQIRSEGPNIVVFMIGENNIFLITDPKGLVGRIESLATMMCNKVYTKEVAICKLLPYLCAPQCISHKMNGRKKKPHTTILGVIFAIGFSD